MILFFDTETTGFPHTTKPDDHPDQPHIVQLAAVLTDDTGAVAGSINFIIDPGVAYGVRIPSKVAEIHGIDEERAWRYGIDPAFALTAFEELYMRADLIVAHNVDFDVQMMAIALKRHAVPLTREPHQFRTGLNALRFCTMKSSTDICRIPGPRGNKWPKLIEAYKHFFNEEFDGAHDAMNDVNAYKRVYFHLKSIGAA